MKVIKKIMAALAFTLLASAFAHNYSISPVYDEAGLLSDEEIQSLNEQINSVVANHNETVGIYIALISSMEDYGYSNVESFSEAWYTENSLGLGSENTGILFLLSMQDRDYNICAHGSYAHTAFTDHGKSTIANYALPYLKNNMWFEAFEKYIERTDYLLVQADNGEPLDVYNDYNSDYEYGESDGAFGKALLIALGVSLILALIIVFTMKGKLNNVKDATQADDYVDTSKVNISYRSDKFSHTSVIRTPLETKSSSGGGTSISSGGFSHSSGKF